MTVLFASDVPEVLGVTGASREMLRHGQLSTIRVVLMSGEPVGEVIVAVVYPRPADPVAPVRAGTEVNVGDPTQWQEDHRDALQGKAEPKFLDIKWAYSADNQVLTFAGTKYSVPTGSAAVVQYNQELKPACEFREVTAAEIAEIRNELEGTGSDGTHDIDLPAIIDPSRR